VARLADPDPWRDRVRDPAVWRDGKALAEAAKLGSKAAKAGFDWPHWRDLLPKLATYLGHKNLSGTQPYLTMTEELLAEAGRRFEAFAQGGRHE